MQNRPENFYKRKKQLSKCMVTQMHYHYFISLKFFISFFLKTEDGEKFLNTMG